MVKLKVLVSIIQKKSEKSKFLLFFEMAAVKDAVSNTCLVNILSSKVWTFRRIQVVKKCAMINPTTFIVTFCSISYRVCSLTNWMQNSESVLCRCAYHGCFAIAANRFAIADWIDQFVIWWSEIKRSRHLWFKFFSYSSWRTFFSVEPISINFAIAANRIDELEFLWKIHGLESNYLSVRNLRLPPPPHQQFLLTTKMMPIRNSYW